MGYGESNGSGVGKNRKASVFSDSSGTCSLYIGDTIFSVRELKEKRTSCLKGIELLANAFLSLFAVDGSS